MYLHSAMLHASEGIRFCPGDAKSVLFSIVGRVTPFNATFQPIKSILTWIYRINTNKHSKLLQYINPPFWLSTFMSFVVSLSVVILFIHFV